MDFMFKNSSNTSIELFFSFFTRLNKQQAKLEEIIEKRKKSSRYIAKTIHINNLWVHRIRTDIRSEQQDPDMLKKLIQIRSVSDPDPGSGAFWTPGSGIQDPEKIFSGSWIRPLLLKAKNDWFVG
jgi:hypothetical protein